MPDNQPHLADPKVRRFADAIAYALMHGKSPDEIVRDLEEQGWNRDDAAALVGKIADACRVTEQARKARAALRKAPLVHFVLGALWCALGAFIIVTATERRDLTPLGIAVFIFGAAQMGWAWRSHRARS